MTRRTAQFGLRSLFIVVTLIAVLFALSPWFDPFTTGAVALLLAGAGCLAWFVVRDVLGIHVALPRGWLRRRREMGVESDGDPAEQAARAAARNKTKKKWWRRKWPNRYKSYQPGQNYTFPGQRDQ